MNDRKIPSYVEMIPIRHYIFLLLLWEIPNADTLKKQETRQYLLMGVIEWA